MCDSFLIVWSQFHRGYFIQTMPFSDFYSSAKIFSTNVCKTHQKSFMSYKSAVRKGALTFNVYLQITQTPVSLYFDLRTYMYCLHANSRPTLYTVRGVIFAPFHFRPVSVSFSPVSFSPRFIFARIHLQIILPVYSTYISGVCETKNEV